MKKQFLYTILIFCFMIVVLQTEFRIDGFCNSDQTTSQNPILMSNAYTTNKQNPLQIIKEAPHFLILQFNLPKLDIKQRHHNGDPYTVVQFDGSSSTTEIGKPKLPVYSVQIGLPSSSSVTTTVLQKQNSFKKVDPPPLTNEVNDPFFPDAQEIYNITSETINSNREDRTILYPDKLVEVVPVGFVREQYIGVIHIQPIQYNKSTQQLKITDNVTFRIDFYGAPPKHAATPIHLSTESPAYENLFQTMLINNNQTYSWRQQKDSLLRTNIPGAPATPSSNRRRFKIPIHENNIYRITYRKLENSGIEPETIDLDSIKVETNGVEQGFYIFDENQNNTYDPEDMLVFYARELNNKFTETNYYWFSYVPKGTEVPVDVTDENGTTRISTRSAAPVSHDIDPVEAFLTKLRFEKNVFHDPLVANSKVSETYEHYFWTGFRGDQSEFSRKQIPVVLPGAIPRYNTEREAVLRVKLQGASYRSAALHHALLSFNDKTLARPTTWKQQQDILMSRKLPQNWIHHDVNNYLRISALDTNNTPEGEYDFYLDWYEFEYWHNFQAKNERLAFNSKTDPEVEGKVVFKVSNFSTDTIDVYVLDNNGLKEKLVGGIVTRTGKYHILFEDEVTQYTRYFAIAHNNYKDVTTLTEISPSNLRSPTNQADYVVITHKTFLESVMPLVEYRRSQGLTVIVVDVDDIYDEFGHGIFTPFAIQWFLRHAYHTWQPPAPTYVLLVGDAHYDYKHIIEEIYEQDPNFRGKYDLYPIFVPTYHGWAPASGETAMDQRFVNVSGDDPLPDMFIGRLSVQTVDELSVMIQKIIDYEQNPKIGPWQGTLVQVADNHLDNPSDEVFESSRDDLIERFIPLGYYTNQIYLRKTRYRELTRNLILRAINDGALVLEYAGHGGIHTWADERIFHLNDVIQLKNTYLPFVITTTCLNGEFDKPQQFGSHCLSEQFLLGQHGAIGSLSASRLTYATANAEFDEDLFTAMFNREPFDPQQGHFDTQITPLTYGKIITDAKISFISRVRNRQWIPGTEQYTLFGDPATPIALPTHDIQVKLEDIALNSTKQIVILNNEVGIYDINQTWWKADEFSTEKLLATAIFHNHFDDEHGNEFVQSTQGRVWQGEYGTLRLNVPSRSLAGRGVVRLFANDEKHAAVGGAYFWVDTPVIADVREVMDTLENHTLTIQALVYDDIGGANGISSIYIEWDNTFTFVDSKTPMVRIPPPPGTGELFPGGQWYQIQTPIPLPQGGRQIRYRIYANDISGLDFVYPSKTERINVIVPEGPNIAIGTDGNNLAPIRYIYNDETERYIFIAELINSGGRTVKTDIDVVFAEGNPDIEGDLIIDEDANILARTTIKPDEWKEGTTALQHVIVEIPVPEALSTGIHKIYVLANPEVDTTDEISTGSVQEPKAFDNKLHITLVVNEFYYVPTEDLTAHSLDKVFEVFLPASAAEVDGDRIPINISSSEPYEVTQPDFHFAPIPRVAALRQGLLRSAGESAQQYEVTFRTPDVTLNKPIKIKLRFDVSGLEDAIREKVSWKEDSPEFRAALIEEAEKLNIFTWHSTYEKWRQLPSQVRYVNGKDVPDPDDEQIFQLENYITPVQTENANKQPFPVETVKFNPYAINPGTWVIVFIEPTQYEVYLKRKNEVTVHKLSKIGQLDIPYREESLGLEFVIPERWVGGTEFNATSNVPFEFGDIIIFETDRPDGESAVSVTGTRNHNHGNGAVVITERLGPEQEFAVGDWFLFFTSSTHYEIRDRSGAPLYLPNSVLVRGKVNESLFLRHLGWEVLVTSSSEPFRFGDKVKFSTAKVATITAETTKLSPFTLMSGSDITPPTFNLWIDGIRPQRGSVIAPRPLISILLEDINGVNLDTFIIRRGDNGKPPEPITDYILRNPKNVDTVPIDYKPILFPGEYTLEFEARDFSGNAIGGKLEKVENRFIVTQMPDITPPTVEIFVNDEILEGEILSTGSNGQNANTEKNHITQQPNCDIRVTDETALNGALLNITFSRISETDITKRYREFDAAEWEFDAENAETATFSFAPNLSNGTYRLSVTAADTSENTTEMEAFFTLDEEVTLKEVFNAPNPVEDGNTFFTYQLAQAPEKVTIKIYTVSGRLIRTLSDASADRGNNETYWDGRDESGIRCANGVYLYRVIAHTDNGTVQKIGKLAILR